MKRYWYITPEDYKEAESNGIDKTLLEQRVRIYGWDIERAIKTKNKRHLLSDEALRKASELGIDRSTVFARMRLGWSEEKAISTPLGNTRRKVFPKWVYETADKYGISYSTVYNRVHRGWGLVRACTERVKDNGRKRWQNI